MLAHHRMRVLFSLFIRRRTNIPASGQNVTMLRIFALKKSIKLSEFLRVSPQDVADKNQNAENHDKGIVLRVSRLNKPDGPTNRSDKAADKTHEAVDDPFVPPPGSHGTAHRAGCGAI